jgi:uncharacterized protein YlzI (FlbEa/FlbD family)
MIQFSHLRTGLPISINPNHIVFFVQVLENGKGETEIGFPNGDVVYVNESYDEVSKKVREATKKC